MKAFDYRGGVLAAESVSLADIAARFGTPPTREYSAQEQEDGEHVIAWLARQPWSNGTVGMFGISWGGFNSIQMAMRRPPALKAILAIEATEALFKEDVHYMDGVMHVDEFEVSMDLDQGRSGAPDFPLDEGTLARRMDSTPWSLDYFRHQRDGAFWRTPSRRFEDILGGLGDIFGFGDLFGGGRRRGGPQRGADLRYDLEITLTGMPTVAKSNVQRATVVDWRTQPCDAGKTGTSPN